MSTQLKAQQGLTNLTPIKVIHILISLAIMVCFKFVPAAEPLTPLGVEVIGIFLGMLYGWRSPTTPSGPAFSACFSWA